MPSKRMNTLSEHTANERSGAATIRASICPGTPSLVTHITTPIARVSVRILSDAEFNKCECGAHSSNDDDDEPEPTSHDVNDVDHSDTIQFERTMTGMRDMLELQHKLVLILFQNADMRPSSGSEK